MRKSIILIITMIIIALVMVGRISDHQVDCYSSDVITTDKLVTAGDNHCGPEYMLINRGTESIYVSGYNNYDDLSVGVHAIEFSLDPGEMYELAGDEVTEYQFDQVGTIQTTVVSSPDPDLVVQAKQH